MRGDLAALAVALGLVAGEAEEAAAVAAVQGWLERNGRWLLIFDNAATPAAIAADVPDGRAGHVLITSRAPSDWGTLGAGKLTLDVWEREESRQFLRQRTGERDIGVLDELAGALGGLPLALEQAAAYANTKAITLTGYIQRLRDRAPELFAAGRPAGYEHTVATVWSVAFEQLADDRVAAGLVLVCAHLAPELIPRELLDAIAQDTDVAVGAASVDDAIGLLLGYALLSTTADSTLGMHRLVQDVARATAGAAARADSAARAVTLIARALPERPWEHEQWPLCARLLEHALSAAGHAERHQAAREDTAVVLGLVGQYQRARAQYAAARDLTVRALAIFEAVYGPEHPQVASTLGNLGIVQEQLGEFEDARATQQRALAIFEAVYGPEHPQVASTLGNLGSVQQQLGEFEDARATQQRALAIKEAVYGPEHPQVAITLTNLGNVQQQLNELQTARACVARAVAIFERSLGPDHPTTKQAREHLASVQADPPTGSPRASRLSRWSRLWRGR